MKHYTFYKNLDKIEKTLIDNFFTNWKNDFPSHIHKIDNLLNEHFLIEKIMYEIYKILNSNLNSGYSQTLDELILHGKENCKKGQTIKGFIPNVTMFAGSVIRKDIFSQYLKFNYKEKFVSDRSNISINTNINNFIDTICVNVNNIPYKYQNIQIKSDNRIIWFTWNNSDIIGDPFFFLETEYAEEARTALGLGYDEYSNEKLLAFVIETKPLHMFRPSICDSLYNDCFRPAPYKVKNHGVIHHLNDGDYYLNNIKQSISDRAKLLPEAVSSGSDYKIKDLKKCKLLITI